jgi:hypothetical protein
LTLFHFGRPVLTALALATIAKQQAAALFAFNKLLAVASADPSK